MPHDARFLTHDEVLAFAAAEGRFVTPAQFKRWRFLGLMPSPVVKGLGRGEGIESRYPVVAGPQLVAVADALANERDATAALWHLWWNGYDIAERRVGALLDAAMTAHEESVQRVEALYDGDGAAEGAVERRMTARLTGPALARVRRRIGKSAFPTFMMLWYEVAAGAYESHDREDAALLRRGLGIGDDSMLTPKILSVVSRLFEPARLRKALAATEPSELNLARDEAKPVLAGMLAIGREQSAALVGSPPDGLFDALVRALPNILPPQVFLVWLMVRRFALYRPAYTVALALLPRPLKEWPEKVELLPDATNA